MSRGLEMLKQGFCPYCGEGPFKQPLSHTYHKHGVLGEDVRREFGALQHESLTDPALYELRVGLNKAQWGKGTFDGVRKSHCIRGHELTEDTTRPKANGGRECLTCKLMHNERQGTATQRALARLRDAHRDEYEMLLEEELAELELPADRYET